MLRVDPQILTFRSRSGFDVMSTSEDANPQVRVLILGFGAISDNRLHVLHWVSACLVQKPRMWGTQRNLKNKQIKARIRSLGVPAFSWFSSAFLGFPEFLLVLGFP